MSGILHAEVDYLRVLKECAEEKLKDVSPLKIILVTAGATYSVALFQKFLSEDPEFSKQHS